MALPKLSTGALNIYADPLLGSATSPTTSPAASSKPEDSDPNYTLNYEEPDYRQHPGLKGLVLDKKNDKGKWESVGNNCNRDDLCCDGDAIVIAKTLENGNDSNSHLLSATLREYYNNSSKLANRFKQIATSVNASNTSGALTAFTSVMSGFPGDFLRRKLADSVSSEVKNKACEKLANYIF